MTLVKFRLALLFGLCWTVVLGCSSGEEEIARLESIVDEQKRNIQEREHAAQQCESLYETERGRYAELERLTRMQLPISLQNSPILHPDTLEQLDDVRRVEVENQLHLYQVRMTEEFETLKAQNAELKRQIRSLGQSVTEEAETTRVEIDTRADELSADLVALRRAQTGSQQNLNRAAQRLQGLIDRIQEFNESEVSCRSCWPMLQFRTKKETVIQFNGELIRALVDVQTSLTESAESGPEMDVESDDDTQAAAAPVEGP